MSDLDSKLVILENQDFQCELNIQAKKKLICFMNEHEYFTVQTLDHRLDPSSSQISYCLCLCFCIFLAAMSSSRSDDVTKSVCLSVCLSVVIFL